MPPVLQRVKEVTGDRATILKMDIDKNQQYSKMYNIMAVPTLIIFKQGKIVWRKNGVSTAQEILQHLMLVID